MERPAFNNVDLTTAREHGLSVVRVPAYSPYAVAEHTAALILALNPKNSSRLQSFPGRQLRPGRTFGLRSGWPDGRDFRYWQNRYRGRKDHERLWLSRVAAYDLRPNPACEALGVHYLPLTELFGRVDILTLHCPLTPETYHLIDKKALNQIPGEAALYLYNLYKTKEIIIYRYKRILVGLNLNEHDVEVIRYASLITHMAHSEKVYFLHVFGSQNIPEAVRKEYYELLEPVEEHTKKRMDEALKQHFDGYEDTEIVSESVEGQWLFELLDRGPAQRYRSGGSEQKASRKIKWKAVGKARTKGPLFCVNDPGRKRIPRKASKKP